MKPPAFGPVVSRERGSLTRRRLFDEESGDIVIGGGAMGPSRKFRNVRDNPQVALVVDDIVSIYPWTARGLEIRGTAVALSRTSTPPSNS